MRKAAASLLLVAALAACGTPQEQCIQAASRELRTLDRLIADQRATISRGYAYTRREVVRYEWQRCDDWAPGHPRRFCYEPVWHTLREPVAIDPEAEGRKLEALLARRMAVLAADQPAIDACKAKFPG